MRTRSLIRTIKTSRRSTESWRGNYRRLKKMFKGYLLKGKAYKIFRVFWFNLPEGRRQPHKLMVQLMRLGKFWALLGWDTHKNLRTQVKWGSKTQQMMHRVGSKNYNKTKVKENDQIIRYSIFLKWYFSPYFCFSS